MAYHTSRKTLLEMFLDRTAGESTRYNRLVTRETENGTVALIGYGWLKLAEYNERLNAVTVFTGHESINSKTVNEWLNAVVNVAEERGRDVILSGESPEEDTPNGGTVFINGYVSMDSGHSAVEQEAVETVRDSLRGVA